MLEKFQVRFTEHEVVNFMFVLIQIMFLKGQYHERSSKFLCKLC